MGIECSTPFGITASGTCLRLGREGDQAFGAQRLSASRRAGLGTHKGRILRQKVLNAFRHHGERDFIKVIVPGDKNKCSTPFGITASGTQVHGLALLRVEVLNAFRHHGERDKSMSASETSRMRAQRLSASRRAGRLFWGEDGTPVSCSTPFGITASGTGLPRGLHRRRVVLNAFRHHGERDCSRARFTPCRAGVLNAFRHHGERDKSGVGATGVPWVVLNAFRHHGERDPRCQRTQGRDSKPASAQRLSASRRAGPERRVHGPAFPAARCSTPFGITASGTSVNSLRIRADECSTPFGITASGTTSGPSSPVPCGSAQRLSASRRAGPYRLQRPSQVVVCSTPFGTRRAGQRPTRLAKSEPPRCSTPFGITASGTWEQEWQTNDREGRCSTPFGITASGTEKREIGRELRRCSTPFGITASGTAGAP